MSRPDHDRGAPPGGYWGPAAVPPGASPTGWSPHPAGAPAPGVPGSGWSAGVTGPGGLPAPGPVGPPDPGRPAPGYPAPGPGGPAVVPAGRGSLDPATLFGLVIAGLGALNFAFGFLPQVTSSRIDESLSVYAVGPGYVPILLLIAGLLALAAFLPGSERSRLAVAAVSVGGAVGALISLGTTSSLELLAAGQVSKGLGVVLLTIFGIIQAVVAIAAYVVGADLRTGPRGGAPGTASVPVAGSVSGPVAAPAAGPVPGGAAGWTTTAPDPSWAAAGPAPHGGPTAPSMPSGWGPPADDDRPTGPQRVVDPFAPAGGAPAGGAPAGPPVAATPVWDPAARPDQDGPASAAGGPATGASGTAARPPVVDGRSPAPDEGMTEAHRIPPRAGSGGSPGS